MSKLHLLNPERNVKFDFDAEPCHTTKMLRDVDMMWQQAHFVLVLDVLEQCDKRLKCFSCFRIIRFLLMPLTKHLTILKE